MAGPYRGHVVAPGSDTCQVDLVNLAYGWTYPEVTRVTTERVTRGTGDVARMTWKVTRQVVRTVDVVEDMGESEADMCQFVVGW
jgi:hypothetical protein